MGTHEIEWRRAISAAYYGLFHELCWEGATGFAVDPDTTGQVARAFDHTTMFKVCRSYLDRDKQKHSASPLVDISDAFTQLQTARHQADYDLAISFSHAEALRLVTLAADAASLWRQTQDHYRRTFLVQLLLGTRLNRRG